MASEINLHELAALPYGEAEKRLRKAGKWDEHAGTGERRKYHCEVFGTVQVRIPVDVDARSHEEAEELAAEAAEKVSVYDWDIHAGSLDVEEVET